jgi:chromosome segregation protein
VVALKDCIRVLNGFGHSLEAILPKLRDGFVAPDTDTARKLALEYPQAFFLSPTGETFHNVTVTGGKPREQGPLALKRELAELQTRLVGVETELAQNELATIALTREIADHTTTLDARNHERRDAERESANSGAALRQMEQESARLESRLQQWQIAAGRNKDQRQQRQDLIIRKRDEAAVFDSERASIEQHVAELTEQILSLRLSREELQVAASAAAAALAGLEERRRNANANFDQTHRLYQSQSQRIAQLESQITSAATEKQRREEETTELSLKHIELTEMRAQAIAEGETLSTEATALRASMSELDASLRTLRHETEGLREQRATLSARAAKLTSDLEHLEATCLNDLSAEATVLREDTTIERIEAEALTAEDEAARTLKQRLEAMGPVNMMALGGVSRRPAQRHDFPGDAAQRPAGLDRKHPGVDQGDRRRLPSSKFDEAFAVNQRELLRQGFTKLFGGGLGFMRLTEIDASNGKSSGRERHRYRRLAPGQEAAERAAALGRRKSPDRKLALLVGVFQFQPRPVLHA